MYCTTTSFFLVTLALINFVTISTSLVASKSAYVSPPKETRWIYGQCRINLKATDQEKRQECLLKGLGWHECDFGTCVHHNMGSCYLNRTTWRVWCHEQPWQHVNEPPPVLSPYYEYGEAPFVDGAGGGEPHT